MTNGLTVTSYDTFDDLLDYMDGSAAVIGEMLLPILEPSSDAALPHARDFAVACRLTECWCDVARDLDRGRVYLPQEDLRRFDADPWLRRVTPEWRALMAFEIRRTHEYFAAGDRIATELPAELCPLRPDGARPARPDARPHRPGRRRRVHRAPERPAVAHGRDRGAPLATEKRRDPARLRPGELSCARDRGRRAREALRRHVRRSTGSPSRSRPARCSACSARTARARPRRSRSSRATAAPTPARCACSGVDPVARRRRAAPADRRDAPGGRALPGPEAARGARSCSRRTTTTPTTPSACSPRRPRRLARTRWCGACRAGSSSGSRSRWRSSAEPKLVFLDEPTAGMDPHARATTWSMIRELRDRGDHRRAHHARDGRSRAPLRPRRDHRPRATRGVRHARGAHHPRRGGRDHVHARHRPAGRRRSPRASASRRDAVRELRPGDYLVDAAGHARAARRASPRGWREQGALLSELRAGRRSLEDVFLRLTGEGHS